MRSRRSLAPIGLLAVVVACSQRPGSVDISPKKLKIYGIERSQRLVARVLDRNGNPMESATATWSSADASVVAAEPGGRLVARKSGKTTVTATYEDVSAQVPVEVVDVSLIEMTPPLLTLVGPAGTSIPLACAVKDSRGRLVDLRPAWTSSNPKVATVSEEGTVTSVAAGTTTIVTRIGDLQGGCDVTVVLREIARLEIRPATALVRVGDSQHFEMIAYGPDGATIPDAAGAFKTSNPDVASVDSAGVALGRKAGTALIRVELAGRSSEATLLVN